LASGPRCAAPRNPAGGKKNTPSARTTSFEFPILRNLLRLSGVRKETQNPRRRFTFSGSRKLIFE